MDLTPLDGAPIALFTTSAGTYRLEAGRTTRLVALAVGEGRILLLAIEPAEDLTLDEILDTADAVAASLHLR